MLGQVEITPGGDSFQFLGSEREFVKEIDRSLGVVRQFLRFLPVFLQRGSRQADAFVPLKPLLDPVFMPGLPSPIRLRGGEVGDLSDLRHVAGGGLHGLVRPDEELQFHLLELARAEGEVARGDFVTKGFAHLADAERHFLAGRFQDVLELGKDGLCGLRAKVGDVLFVRDRADVGFEHQVERARRSQVDAGFRMEVDRGLQRFLVI